MLLSVQNFLKLNPLIRQRQPKMLETALRSLQLFQVFGEYPEDIQRQLASVAYLEEFEPGKMIIKEGQVPERYYMVLSGQALRSRAIRLPAGNMQLKIHGIISTGMDFGNEEQILTNMLSVESRFQYLVRRNESVFAKTKIYLLTLDRDDFLNIFHFHGDFDGLKDSLKQSKYFKVPEWPLILTLI